MAKKLTFEDVRERKLLLYEYIRGSHAHGTATETSDEDRGGVYICPPEELLGLGIEYQQQIENDSHDIVWWELNRFMELLLKSNPTVLESLFVPEHCIIYEHPIIKEIKKHRDKFITKACFGAFSGYSRQQIIKAKSLNKKSFNPVQDGLGVLDFCYVPYKNGSSKLNNFLEYRSLNQRFLGINAVPNMKGFYAAHVDFGAFFRDENISLDDMLKVLHDDIEYDTIAIVREMKNAQKENNTEEVLKWEALLKKAQRKNLVKFICEKYDLNITGPGVDDVERDAIFASWFNDQKPIGYCGLVREDGKSTELKHYEYEKTEEYVEHSQKDENSVILCSIPKESKVVCHIYFNKDGWQTYKKDLREYKDWVEHRNPERFRLNIEHKRGYDSKNMSQSAYLQICGVEIARGEGFKVERTDPEEVKFLLAIKRGKFPYEELIKFSEEKDKEMRDAMEHSTLPDNIDADFVNELLLDIRHRQLKGEI